jgi:hypothetical protein
MPGLIFMHAIALSLIFLMLLVAQTQKHGRGNFWIGGTRSIFRVFLFQSALTYFSSAKYFLLAESMATHPSRHPTKLWRLSGLRERDEATEGHLYSSLLNFLQYTMFFIHPRLKLHQILLV